MPEIIIRSLTSVEELKEIASLEKAIWGMDPLPVHQTFTAAKNGGIILGAYDRDRLVGFLYSFPGFQDGKVYLCSHMMGIHPDFQRQKLGERLKKKQRELALDRGYETIVWTFDPLQSLNAYLNLHKLGAVASRYIEDLYGKMTDSLNVGLPSDRFQVEWRLSDGNVFQHFDGEALFEVSTDGLPRIVAEKDFSFSKHDCWLVPIPSDFPKMKAADLKLALDWRLKTRKAFRQLIDEGFVGVDLIRAENNVSHYVFVREGSLD